MMYRYKACAKACLVALTASICALGLALHAPAHASVDLPEHADAGRARSPPRSPPPRPLLAGPAPAAPGQALTQPRAPLDLVRPPPAAVGAADPDPTVPRWSPPRALESANCTANWSTDPTNADVWGRSPEARSALLDTKQAGLASDKACALQRKVAELWVGKWHSPVTPVPEADLLRKWPGCFLDAAAAAAAPADLRALTQDAAWRTRIAGLPLSHATAELNQRPLVLNPGHRPRGYHVPVVITTVEKNAPKLQQTLVNLRSVDGLSDAPLLLAIEGFSLALLDMIVHTVLQGYVQLYFIPVGKCYANRPQRSDEDNKDFKINLSFLWIMHVAMVRLGYPYVILLEDDMAPGPDFYLHHVALSHVALADPSVVAVMASNAGIYYDCMGPLRAHLLATSHEHDPNAVYYANEVMPWGAGYTWTLVRDLLRWYVTHEFTGLHHRYDIIMNRLLGPDRYSLFPMVWRIHGDPKHYHLARRRFPALRTCDHARYHSVWPPHRRGTLQGPPGASLWHVFPGGNFTVHRGLATPGRAVTSGRVWEVEPCPAEASERLLGAVGLPPGVAAAAPQLALSPDEDGVLVPGGLSRALATHYATLVREFPTDALRCAPGVAPTLAAFLARDCALPTPQAAAVVAARLCLRLPRRSPDRDASVAPPPAPVPALQSEDEDCWVCLTFQDLLLFGMWDGVPAYVFAIRPRADARPVLTLGKPLLRLGLPVYYGPTTGPGCRVAIGDGPRQRLCSRGPAAELASRGH